MLSQNLRFVHQIGSYGNPVEVLAEAGGIDVLLHVARHRDELEHTVQGTPTCRQAGAARTVHMSEVGLRPCVGLRSKEKLVWGPHFNEWREREISMDVSGHTRIHFPLITCAWAQHREIRTKWHD
jgi:hypothetical protein